MLLLTTHAFAQDFEVVKFETAFYPLQSIEDATVNGEIGFWEWGGELAHELETYACFGLWRKAKQP